MIIVSVPLLNFSTSEFSGVCDFRLRLLRKVKITPAVESMTSVPMIVKSVITPVNLRGCN